MTTKLLQDAQTARDIITIIDDVLPLVDTIGEDGNLWHRVNILTYLQDARSYLQHVSEMPREPQ